MKNLTIIIAILFSTLVFSQQSNLYYSSPYLEINSSYSNHELTNRTDETPLDTLIFNILDKINPDSIKQTIQGLQDFGTRFMLAPNRKEVASWIQNKYLSYGITNTVIDSFQTHTIYNGTNVNTDTVTWQYNVIATFEGKHNPDNVYMTSGHYDSYTNDDPMNIAPGADDDASGVAAAVEIGRVIMETGFEPNSTIKLAAFAAEELMNYSDESGSSYYANSAVSNNENIVFYITNDMIATSEAITDWKFDLLNHDSIHWATNLGMYVSNKYTSLTPTNIEQGDYGADDYPFYLVGIPALFFMEDEFSPYYHSNNDLVEHCNMDYCAEVTKVTAAMLVHASETPLNICNYFISNPGDGNTLIPTWKANNENDLAGYHVYIGTESGIYDTVYTTADTSYIISDLNADLYYFIGVSAFNNDGHETPIWEKTDAPVIVSMDNGILIVNDSEGGFLNPSNEDIMQFYDSLCINFQHEQLDVTTLESVPLGTLGQYSSILWHINNFQWVNPALQKSTDALRNFMNLGGHVFLTIFKPGKNIDNVRNYPATYEEGSFLYDCAHVASSENDVNRWFSGAYPANETYGSIYIDSVKITALNHCIPYVEAMTPTSGGEIIYLYDTNFDTTMVQGSYYGQAVGIENSGPDKNMVIISFPLFYTEYSQARALVYNVMHDKFGETYLEIEQYHSTSANNITTFPNPAINEFSFILDPAEHKIIDIKFFSLDGKIIKVISKTQISDKKQIMKVDISDIKSGIYVLQVISNKKIFTNKILKL